MSGAAGAAGAACAWVIFSELYSWYVNHIARASALYGSLSVLLLMLLWLYACLSILFYGALLMSCSQLKLASMASIWLWRKRGPMSML